LRSLPLAIFSFYWEYSIEFSSFGADTDFNKQMENYSEKTQLRSPSPRALFEPLSLEALVDIIGQRKKGKPGSDLPAVESLIL
jgi:hypothetical protein